jgi:site-specific recombinase XerD
VAPVCLLNQLCEFSFLPEHVQKRIGHEIGIRKKSVFKGESQLRFELSVLRAFWNYLVTEGLATSNPLTEFLASSKRGCLLSEQGLAVS